MSLSNQFPPDLAIAILAGGASRRFGRDKASVTLDGQTLLERTISCARSVAAPVWVVGRVAPENWTQPEVSFVPDLFPGAGPLGGLLTALHFAHAQNEQRQNLIRRVMLLACDLPRLHPDVLRWLIDSDNVQRPAHGCVAWHEEPLREAGRLNDERAQLEPLLAIYHLAIEPLAQAHFTQQRRALHGLIEAGDFARAPLPPQWRTALFNLNTLEDWAALQNLATPEVSKRKTR